MEKKNRAKLLTKAELQLMNILWDKGESTVSAIHESLKDPKPAYTTVLTVFQVLTKKGIVSFRKEGKQHVYMPILTREEYIGNFMDETCENLFGGSARSFFSFFATREKITKKELEEILKEMGD